MLKQLDATLRERYSKDGVRQAMLGTLNVDVDRLDDPLKSRGEALQKNRLKNLVDDNRLAAFSLKDSKSHFEKAIPDSSLSAAEKKACARLIQAVRNIDVADDFALNSFQRMEPAKGIVDAIDSLEGAKLPQLVHAVFGQALML